MIEIKKNYNTAKCFCNTLEETARLQIETLCNMKEFAEQKIRIMPDVHAGKGATIGTTMTIGDKFIPSMVGVDIGCGMETVQIAEKKIKFDKLDQMIHKNIPAGRNIRSNFHLYNNQIDLGELRCLKQIDLDYAHYSLGTLGGGNHFIEVDRDDSGNFYLIIHSGSRHLGVEVASYYQDEAYRNLSSNSKIQIDEIITELKSRGEEQQIQATLEQAKTQNNKNKIKHDLAYVVDDLFTDYIHDMKIVQKFAVLNRQAMITDILTKMHLTAVDEFTTIHNYIDTEKMILRKGAVSAQLGEKLLIPLNMRDGSLICTGLGNEDWNSSAPHGAGRKLSRKKALNNLSLTEYQKQMNGIFSTSVGKQTLDEAPMAYKKSQEIISEITPTAKVEQHLRSTYNFKATE